MFRAVWRGKYRQAAAWLLGAMLTYALWAILNDAMIHGWHHLTLI